MFISRFEIKLFLRRVQKLHMEVRILLLPLAYSSRRGLAFLRSRYLECCSGVPQCSGISFHWFPK